MTRWGNPKTLMQDAAHQVDAARYISLRFLCCLIASRASKMHKLKTLPNTDTSNGFFSLKNSIAKISVFSNVLSSWDIHVVHWCQMSGETGSSVMLKIRRHQNKTL